MPSSSPRRGTRRGRTQAWKVGVPVVTAAAGVLFVASAISADGSDLRSVTTDLRTLVVDRGEDVDAATDELQDLRTQVDELAGAVDDTAVNQARRQARRLQPAAGLSEVTGPGLRITLTDAPREVIEESGQNPNFLVVHQQDIQAFVNAMWAAGAEAVTLQGQRLVSTTGIRCVGNTVLLHSVPYSPPYVIEAVGDVGELYASLEDFDKIDLYRDYVERWQLGLEIELVDELVAPPYAGTAQLEHAAALTG
jgi:uncharacterized protein YlxW (UPF0749 family)